MATHRSCAQRRPLRALAHLLHLFDPQVLLLTTHPPAHQSIQANTTAISREYQYLRMCCHQHRLATIELDFFMLMLPSHTILWLHMVQAAIILDDDTFLNWPLMDALLPHFQEKDTREKPLLVGKHFRYM